MKKIIEFKLKYWAKLVLAKYKPEVIGITGSVGKTSAKAAIFAVLSGHKNVRQSEKNYNNEIGLPLAILDAESPGRNALGWLLLGFKFVGLMIKRDKNYPEILILEMGIDQPGDMDYLNSIVKCKVGVATAVGSVHLENFKNRVELQKEKAKLIKGVIKDGWAIVNFDDPETKKMIDVSRVKTMTYGFGEGAQVRASNVAFSYGNGSDKEGIKGISFKIFYKESSVPVHIPGALGFGMVYSALAGAAVGLVYGLNLHQISQGLLSYKSPKGRLNIVKGIKNTTIIDDTYNSEPKSAALAVTTFRDLKTENGQKKLAALGDMLELGSVSVESHKEIGRLVCESKIDTLFAVGERARDIARGAKEAGMREENVFIFDNSVEAGKFIQNRIKPGDYILVKGSQGIRMEKIVLELMAEPLRALELIVRQEADWKDK